MGKLIGVLMAVDAFESDILNMNLMIVSYRLVDGIPRRKEIPDHHSDHNY